MKYNNKIIHRFDDNIKINDESREWCEHFFETKFNRKPIFLNSATSGIYLFFKSLNLKDTDEVIVQDYTHPVCKNVLTALGHKYVTCKNNDLLIDVDDAISKCNTNTKVIVYTMLNGFVSSDILKLKNFCASKDILLLEDASPALGNTVQNQLCGTIGDAAVFSFNMTKLIALGGGGCFISKHKYITEYVENHYQINFSKSNDYEALTFHITWSLWDLLKSELEKYDEYVEQRQDLHDRLKKKIPHLYSTDSSHCYNAASVLLPNDLIHKKELLTSLLTENKIKFRQNVYHYEKDDTLYKSHIDLPFHRNITDDHIDIFCKIFRDAGIT